MVVMAIGVSLLQRTGEISIHSRYRGLEDRITEALDSAIDREDLARLAAIKPDHARRELEQALEEITRSPLFNIESEHDRKRLIAEYVSKILGFGPLDNLLGDPTVTEIMVNGCNGTFYEQHGKIHKAPASFETDEQVRAIIDRIISPLGRRIDERSPLVNGRLASGHRIHAVIPPLAIDGPVLTIRKFRETAYDLSELVTMGSMPQAVAQLLSWLVRARKNIAVTGGTGSGKTTLLNALSNCIDSRERIITIEDSAELKFERHPHVVRLESRAPNLEGEGEVSIRDLVITSLRMRPDRIVVGEVRGKEALEMLQAMNTGHDGSLTTLHANSPSEVTSRLVTMVGYGAALDERQILAQISSAFDVIVHQERFSDGLRRLSEVVLLGEVEDYACSLKSLVKFERTGHSRDGKVIGQWRFLPDAELLDELIVKGATSRAEVDRWMSSLH